MRARSVYLLALAVAAFDQASKAAVSGHLLPGESVPLLGGVLRLTSVHNRGGAFGLFQSSAGLLTFTTVAVVVAIILLIRRRAALPRLAAAGLALQMGGALGNMVDRIRLGYVVDFVDLAGWPVFNLADSAITVGIFLLAYHLFFRQRRPSNARAC